MDASFVPIEIVPSKTPFGLDQLRRSYKTPLSATDAIAAAPSVGDADETFPNMFLMPITTPESSESATRVDLVYMGSFTGELPAQKHDANTAVQSAASSRAFDGRTADPPLSLQYFAPTSQLSYLSFGAPGTDIVDDPIGPPTIITLTVRDIVLVVGTSTLQALVDAFFTLQITETHESTEVVPAQYWINSSKKIMNYQPYIFDYAPGAYLQLAAPGQNYSLSDILTVTGGGGTGTLTVTQLGISNSITGFTLGSNSYTTAQNFIPATGGTGSGAQFNVFIIT